MSNDHGDEYCDEAVTHPPGFRFSPTEEELLGFYLKNKLEKRREDAMETVIPVLNIYQFDPWQLPRDNNSNNNKDWGEWFFFCPMQERVVHGGRQARTTPSGYWKATGSPRLVYSSSNRGTCRVLGEKKTMVFYMGRAPSGRKTKWKMNEYRALEEDAMFTLAENPKLRNEFSVCRVYLGTVRSFDRRPEASSSTKNQPRPRPQGTSSQDGLSPSSSGNDNVYGHSHTVEAEEEAAAFDWNSLLHIDDCGLLDGDWNEP